MRHIAPLRHLVVVLAAVFASACGMDSHTRSARAEQELDTLLAALGDAPDPAIATQVEAQIWSRWSDSGSPTVNVLLERAKSASDAGEVERAYRFLDQASDLAPDFAEPWNRRANIAYEAEDYSAAIRDIQEALKREPRHFGALAGLALIYEELGQDRAALAAYRAALAIHPYYEIARRGAERVERRIEGADA